VSGALYDRTCRISMDYQSAEAEQRIVDLQVRVDPGWRASVVALVRSTREHPDVRFGSSVRGAIDICRLAVELARIRRTGTGDWHVGLAAAKASLSGRIRLHDACDRTPEQIVTELYVGVFGAEPTSDDDAAPDSHREERPGEH
jgi:MoxR-like ATPase